jgi:hypothetical protein
VKNITKAGYKNVFEENLTYNFVVCSLALQGKGEILFYCRLALLKKQAKNFRDDCNTYEF